MADSKKKRPRRSFGDEFKREAAALYRSSDVSAEQVGAELGLHFTNVERMRKLGDTLYDAYSLLYSESHPDTMSGYRDCLDKSIERMGTKTRLVFDDWVKLIEKTTEDSDLLARHVDAHVDISTKLSGFVLGNVPSDSQVCYAEHLERTKKD
ncbi:MAG: hypothetical protein OXH31_00650 [Gammaproteobacteria bacterium]|nr:hypothetical protein [Gammaproteobacteria bacterium]